MQYLELHKNKMIEWYSNKYCAIYEAQVEETCLELDIPFLPLYKSLYDEQANHNLFIRDGIHLNNKGHELIYKKLSNWMPLINWINNQ